MVDRKIIDLERPCGVSEQAWGHAIGLLNTFDEGSRIPWKDRVRQIEALLNLAERTETKVASGILPKSALEVMASMLENACQRGVLPPGTANTFADKLRNQLEG